jgi:hypothetical protein
MDTPLGPNPTSIVSTHDNKCVGMNLHATATKPAKAGCGRIPFSQPDISYRKRSPLDKDSLHVTSRTILLP